METNVFECPPIIIRFMIGQDTEYSTKMSITLSSNETGMSIPTHQVAPHVLAAALGHLVSSHYYPAR